MRGQVLRTWVSRVIALLLAGAAGPALAADLDGSRFGALWGLPFAGLLLSIALMPLLAPAIWHRHFGKISAGWALALLLPLLAREGAGTTGGVLLHTAVAEYLPFVILLTALFTTAGGIFIRGNLHGSPGLNVGLLAVGAALASVMGTTGASMLMVRPLIRANDNRPHNVHVLVFFIFIVSNAGGALDAAGRPATVPGLSARRELFLDPAASGTAHAVHGGQPAGHLLRAGPPFLPPRRRAAARPHAGRPPLRHRGQPQLRLARRGGGSGADERAVEAGAPGLAARPA